MTDPNSPDRSLRAESAFVYGTDATAVTAMAVGLALRRYGSFAWADCSISPNGSSRGPRTWLARGRTRSVGAGVDESDLIARGGSWVPLARLLVPESRMDSLHLMSYLTLPGLIQELAALSTAPGGESSVLLANVDALDPALRMAVIGDAQVHFRLRQSEVALFVTSRGLPTRRERRLFNRIFHVEVPANAIWSEGFVSIEPDGGSGGEDGPVPIRNAWAMLGLDPTLVPPP